MTFRNYLAGVILVALLIWGPINHSWPAWLLIRISYLVIIPLAVWFIIGWLWNLLKPHNKIESALVRILSGVISIALFVLASLKVTSKYHIGNTQSVQTRDGIEAVGDDIVVQGPDWGNVFVLVVLAFLVFWFGVLKKSSNTSGD